MGGTSAAPALSTRSIAPPGGRGPSKAESNLFTALLGRQGEVAHIPDASLADDRDDTGRSLVTRALGALDKDPLVAGILGRLEERVDAVFVPSRGRFKTSAESHLVKMQEHLRSQVTELTALRASVSSGGSIQRDVVRLQDERERLVGELAAADQVWKAAKAQEENVQA
jgi:hypothetical protein